MRIIHSSIFLFAIYIIAGSVFAATSRPARADSVIIGPGSIPRLQSDSFGNIHLAYLDANMIHYRLFSATWSGPEDVPGSNGATFGKYGRHRMAVTPNGSHIYMSWGYNSGNEIMFGYRNADGWHGPETACPIDSGDDKDGWEYGSVAAQSTGDVYVFCQFDNLWVAHRSPSGVWQPPAVLVPDPDSTYKHVTSNTDSTDGIHVFFRHGPVQYIHGDGTNWSPHLPACICGKHRVACLCL